MKSLRGIKVPKIFWEYSRRRLLVMEYIDGVRVDDVQAIREFGLNPKRIAQNGFVAYMTQIFEDGFFHGDPHPGNLLVTRDGDIAFLDFGIVGVIRPERKFWFVQFIDGMVEQDAGLIIKSLEGLSVKIPEQSREQLIDEIYSSLLEAEGITIGQFNFSGMTNAFTTIVRNYRIQIPSNLMLMLKVIVMVLDVGVTLDPDFNFKKESEKFLSQYNKHESLIEQIASRARGSTLETIDGDLGYAPQYKSNAEAALARDDTDRYRRHGYTEAPTLARPYEQQGPYRADRIGDGHRLVVRHQRIPSTATGNSLRHSDTFLPRRNRYRILCDLPSALPWGLRRREIVFLWEEILFWSWMRTCKFQGLFVHLPTFSRDVFLSPPS